MSGGLAYSIETALVTSSKLLYVEHG